MIGLGLETKVVLHVRNRCVNIKWFCTRGLILFAYLNALQSIGLTPTKFMIKIYLRPNLAQRLA